MRISFFPPSRDILTRQVLPELDVKFELPMLFLTQDSIFSLSIFLCLLSFLPANGSQKLLHYPPQLLLPLCSWPCTFFGWVVDLLLQILPSPFLSGLLICMACFLYLASSWHCLFPRNRRSINSLVHSGKNQRTLNKFIIFIFETIQEHSMCFSTGGV